MMVVAYKTSDELGHGTNVGHVLGDRGHRTDRDGKCPEVGGVPRIIGVVCACVQSLGIVCSKCDGGESRIQKGDLFLFLSLLVVLVTLLLRTTS